MGRDHVRWIQIAIALPDDGTGIGPVYAKKLLLAFGDKVFDIIEGEPARLREVAGIGPLHAKRITEAWAEQKDVREIMVFLHEHGVGTAQAVRIALQARV